MSVESTIQAHLEGIKGESYFFVDLPHSELGKVNMVRSLIGRIILFQDGHKDFYKKGLLKESDNELYFVEWLANNGEKVNEKYHIDDLTGLMVQSI